MLLSSQDEVLRRRLSLQIPSAAPMTTSSPEFQSLSTSPTFNRPVYASSWTPEPENTSTYPRAIPTQPGSTHRRSIGDSHIGDSPQLCEVNQQIKATLTELLNTDSVRSDEKYRAWIQGRLMDAEQKIRKQRRRRSSSSSVERELASSIAEHFDHPLTSCKTWS